MRFPISFLLAALCMPALAAAAEPSPSPLDAKINEQTSQGSGLTSDEVVKRAKTTSFQLRGEQEKIRAAAAAVDEALAGYIPRLTVTGRYTRLSPITQGDIGTLVAAPSVGPGPIPAGTQLVNVALEFPVLLNNTSFQGQLVIPLSDYFLRVRHGVSAARSNERAAVYNESSVSQQIGVDSRVAYYDWVRARLQQIVAEQSLEQSKANLSDVQKQAQVGTASRADVLRVQSQVAQAELVVVRAVNLSELTQEQLRTLMHDPSDKQYVLGEDVRLDLPPVVGDESLNALLGEASKRRPELKALTESAEAQRAQGRSITAGYLPRLELFGDVYYQNPNQRIVPSEDKFSGSWDVGVQATWVLSDIPGTAAQKRQSSAQVAQIEFQRSQVADSIRIEIISALQGVKEARASIGTATTGLQTAEEAYRVQRVLFQNGRATSLELTNAELNLTQARLDLINTQVNLRVARTRLLKSIGM